MMLGRDGAVAMAIATTCLNDTGLFATAARPVTPQKRMLRPAL
jgi:hypothetical protein